MRLSVQGCLILLLCFFSTVSFAAGFDWDSSGSHSYGSAQAACDDRAASQHPGYKKVVLQPSSSAVLGLDSSQWGSCEVTLKSGYQYDYILIYWRISGPVCDSPNFIHPDTGDCVSPQSPSECREVGELYDPATNLCATECPSGALNGVCLKSLEPDPDTCNPSSEDWRGDVDQGFGNPPLSICGDTSCTIGDAPGQSGIFNGQLVCLSQDYGAPKCQGDTITVIDEYGFICAGIDPPEAPDTPEEPNEDTTGDGEPDTYNPDSDPNINRKQLDDLKDGQGKSNQSLSNLEELGKGSNKRLDGIGEALDLQNELSGDANRTLRDIELNTGAAANTLDEINQGMTPPEGGFNPDGFGGLIPTFEETGAQFIDAIGSMPAVQALTDFSTISSNTTCPVYTLPATPVSGPLVMDIHCSIFEEYRSVFASMFLYFWAGIALFIVFKA